MEVTRKLMELDMIFGVPLPIRRDARGELTPPAVKYL